MLPPFAGTEPVVEPGTAPPAAADALATAPGPQPVAAAAPAFSLFGFASLQVSSARSSFLP